MSETFIKLTDKLYIYKDKKSKNFYVYLRKKEGSESERSIRISTRTSDIEQATRKAWALYTNYHDSSFIEEVSKRKQPTVKKIGLKVIELLMIEDKKINTDYIRVINEIIEKIGSTRIKKLDRIIVKDYLSEFANSKTQLTIRKSCFNKIINRAIDEKIITEAEAIKVPTVKLKQADTKQMFNHEHLSIFSENIDNFINEAKRESSRDKRFIFKHYMTFLLETGARSGEETSHIKFSDFVVEEKENIIRENVSTNHQMISSISIPKLNKKGLIDRDYVHLKITAGKIHSKQRNNKQNTSKR
jgi:integrase